MLSIFKASIFSISAFVFSVVYFFNLSQTVGADFYSTFFGIILIYTVMTLGYFKFDSLINPVSLLFPLALGFFYYGFFISERQYPLSFTTISLIIVFFTFYVVGCFTKVSYYGLLIKIQDSKPVNLTSVLIIYFLGVLVFILECLINGGLPLYTMIVMKKDIYAELKHLPILHYFVMFHAIFPSIFYFFKKSKIISGTVFFLFSAVSLFILFNNLSRQVIILCVLCFFFVYSSANKLKPDALIFKGLIVAIVVFFGLGQVRVSAINEEITPTDYIKLYSDIPKHYDVNIFDATFNLYASLNFQTLNDIVLESESNGNIGFGKYLLKPVITVVKADEAFQFSYPPEQDSYTRLGTIIADPYLDFGYLGVAVFSFLYGAFSSFIFRLYRSVNNLGISIVWSVIVFVMVMAVFTNFFNLLFIWACLAFGFYLSSILNFNNFKVRE